MGADMKRPFALGYATDAPCAHCKRPVRQLYMLRDAVWARAIRADRGFAGSSYVGINLHIGCVERRLKRRLTTSDFYFRTLGKRC